MSRTIIDVAAVDCALVEADWTFASDEEAAVEAHWTHRVAGNPDLYNGPVLLLRAGEIERSASGSSVFRGTCFQSDFKTFMAWREFGHPETGVRNIFAMAAIQTSDGALVLGEMAPHTAPAGQIYFPSGTPDLTDVKNGRVDIEGSAARELLEETGLCADDVTFLPGMTLVMDAVRVCCMKRVRSRGAADDLVRRIQGWLSSQDRPELVRMHIVRSSKDIQTAMPDFVADYIRHTFAQS